jgi:hypothetical protein
MLGEVEAFKCEKSDIKKVFEYKVPSDFWIP